MQTLSAGKPHGKQPEGFFGKRIYFYAALLLSVPLYLVINEYVKSIGVGEDEMVSSLASGFFLLGVFAGRYLSRLWTIRQRPFPKAFVVVLVTVIITCVCWLFFHADFPFNNQPAINLLLFWLPFMVVSLAVGLCIKIVHTLTQQQLTEARTEAAASRSELQHLQSQLSPHFLFNTLNNLYGLSLTQHEKIPPLLLKLSELLRYSVYDASELLVPLQDELTYINNYIDFEKIRIGDRLVLNTDLEEVRSKDIRIAPMLLIVFIENAFKHAKNSAEQQIFIDIALKTWGDSILFSAKNSYRRKEEAAMTDRHSGFGLASVRKRLELQYAGDYELTIREEEPTYLVMLQLKMK